MSARREDAPTALERRSSERYARILRLAHARAEDARLDRAAVLAGRGI